MTTETLYSWRDAQSTPRLVFFYRCTKDSNVDPAEVSKNGRFLGTFRQEGKVVDSLFGDTTHMPNFGMIQPLGEELPHGR